MPRQADKLRRKSEIPVKEAAIRTTTILLERLGDETLNVGALNKCVTGNAPFTYPPGEASRENRFLAPRQCKISNVPQIRSGVSRRQ